jgi:PPM family protein phosphatase
MKIRPGVELASLTDVGCVRENNEDSYSYWEPESDELFRRVGRLLVVADGMGGYGGGEVASQMATSTITDVYAHSQQSDIQQSLLQAFAEAHRRIRQRARENDELRGMGTTCIALALVNGHFFFAHIGDSRLYFLTQGKVRCLSHDHTLISRWVENGIIRAEDAENHPQRHVLTAALGVADDIQPDRSSEPIPVRKGDVLMVCTDGLWGQVKDDEIQHTLSTCSPADSCRILCNLAKDRGGPDNITLQVLRVG